MNKSMKDISSKIEKTKKKLPSIPLLSPIHSLPTSIQPFVDVFSYLINTD